VRIDRLGVRGVRPTPAVHFAREVTVLGGLTSTQRQIMSELLLNALFVSQPSLDALSVSDPANKLVVNNAALYAPFSAVADQRETICRECVLSSVDFGFRPIADNATDPNKRDHTDSVTADVVNAIEFRIAAAQRELSMLLSSFGAQQEVIERLEEVDRRINLYHAATPRRKWAKKWFEVLRLEGQLVKLRQARQQSASDRILIGYAPQLWPLIESWRTALATIEGLKPAEPTYLSIEPASSLDGLSALDEAGLDVLDECDQELLWTAVQQAHAAQSLVQRQLNDTRDPTASLDLVEAFINEQQTQEVVAQLTGGISTDRCTALYPYVLRSRMDARAASIKLAVKTAQARRSALVAMLIELDRAPQSESESDIHAVLEPLVRDIAGARLRAETPTDEIVIQELEAQLEAARLIADSLRDAEWAYPPTLDEIDESILDQLMTERAELHSQLGKPMRLGAVETQRQRLEVLQHDRDRARRGEAGALTHSVSDASTISSDGAIDGDAFSYARNVIFAAGEHPGVRIGRRHHMTTYSMPLVLDDPFVALNDATLYAVLDWLCGAPIDRQLILLTEDPRVHQWADARSLLRSIAVPTELADQREVRVFSAQRIGSS
jgi:hypothetical protein